MKKQKHSDQLETKSGSYIPEKGDIVWLNFNPTLGHEQNGRRPAIVLSPVNYNGKTKLMLCCPITSSSKNYSFEVQYSGKIKGVILADHMKSLSWTQREIQFIEKSGQAVIDEVLLKIILILKGANMRSITRHHDFTEKTTLIKEEEKGYRGFSEHTTGSGYFWNKTKNSTKAFEEKNWDWFDNNEPDNI